MAIVDEIFNKKMGVNFFLEKRPNPGGGSEEGLVKDHTFPAFFFLHPSLRKIGLLKGTLIASIGGPQNSLAGQTI